MQDAGKLLIRLSLGILILFHGLAKLGGVEKIGAMLAGFGLPALLANLVYIGEIAAPLLLMVGLWTRSAALLVATTMVAAIFLAHRHQLTDFTANGGYALELQIMFLTAALAIALMGAGQYSLDGRLGGGLKKSRRR